MVRNPEVMVITPRLSVITLGPRVLDEYYLNNISIPVHLDLLFNQYSIPHYLTYELQIIFNHYITFTSNCWGIVGSVQSGFDPLGVSCYMTYPYIKVRYDYWCC